MPVQSMHGRILILMLTDCATPVMPQLTHSLTFIVAKPLNST